MAYFSNASTIIARPFMFDETHVPDAILARDHEIKKLEHCIAPALTGKKPVHAWVLGPSGSGKTGTVKHVLGEIQKQHKVQWAYVSCWDACTCFAVVERLVRDLRILGAEAQSLSLKLERLAREIGSKPFMLVIDEIDRASPKERSAILYQLATWEKLGLVAISYGHRPFLELDSRARSRLHPSVVEFHAYTPEQLQAILARRAELALLPQTWDSQLLAKIAELSEGNCRVAIQALRNAAYNAERERSAKIEERHLDGSWNAVKELKKKLALDALTPHHRLLYEIVAASKEIVSGDLWRLYVEQCKVNKLEPIAERTYLEYLNKLTRLRLLEAEWQVVGGRKRVFRVKSQ